MFERGFFEHDFLRACRRREDDLIMEIDKTTMAEAHEVAMAEIMQNKRTRSIDIETELGKWEKTWEFPDVVTLIVRKPLQEPMASPAANAGYGPRFVEQYRNDLCSLKLRAEYPGLPPVYTYPWRIFDYPRAVWLGSYQGSGPGGNGDGFGVNQVDQIVRRLLKNHESRRANIVTWDPEIDGEAEADQPCLQVLHFLIRLPDVEEIRLGYGTAGTYQLHMRCFFRSHDYRGGVGNNMVGLAGFMEMLVQKLIAQEFSYPLEVGSLTISSSSAHIYWERDSDDLKKFKALMYQNYGIFIEER